MVATGIILTEKCDFKCEYCTIKDIKNKRTVTMEQIKKYSWVFDMLNNIRGEKLLTLAGGDVGYVPEKILDEIFSRVNFNVIISCQHEFINTGFLEKYNTKITEVQYHISDLTKIEKINIIKTDKMLLGIVDKNLEKIDKFLSINKHLEIDYIDIDNTFEPISIKEIKNKTKKLLNIIKKHNLNSYVTERLEKKYNYSDVYINEKRNNCYKNFDINIDFVRGVIFKCFRDYNDIIKLTPENLKNSLLKSPYKYNNICDSCSRLFLNQAGISIKERIELVKYLNKGNK